MKEVRTKHRLLPIAMLALALALVVGICGFLVPAPTAHAEEATRTSTYTTAWRHSRSAPMQVVEGTELMFFNDNAVYANPTNILEQPGNTAYFQMRVNKSSAWSAFMLLDKFDIEDPASGGKAQWKGLSFNDTSNSIPFDKHMRLIFQDGSGQHFTGHKATYDRDGKTTPNTTARAVKNPVASWSDSLVGVEIHIGTGAEDKTYIKVNDSILIDEDDDNIWGNLTTSTFAEGCFIAVHANLLSPMQTYIGEIGAPIITSLPTALKNTMDMTKAHPVGEDDTQLQVKVKNLKDADTAIVKLNGTALVKETDYTVTKADDVVTVQLKHNVFDAHAGANAHDLPRQSYITIEDADETSGKMSKAHIMLTCQNNIPPSVAQSYIETKTLEDGVSYEITYASADGSALTASALEISDGVHADIIDSATKLTANTDYTVTAGENNKYTLTFTKTYLEKIFADYYGRAFAVKIGEDTLILNLRYVPATEGWITRTNDVTGEVKADDYYTYIPMNRFGESKLAARVYHSQAVDVTKPIFVEFDGLPETGGVWTMFNVAKSLKQMDYFKDGVTAESALQAIFFAGRTDYQKLHGFSDMTSTNDNYTETKQTGNVIELFFGDGTKDGYIKINGEKLNAPTAKQSDFPSKKAYIGWFNANPVTFDFKLNTHLNAIAIESKDDSGFKMDLADGKDFTVKLVNYAAGDTIVVKNGDTALDAADYSFDAASGNLTIKGTYFGKIPFSKQGVFSVWNDTAKTGTQFTMIYSSSNMKNSAIAFATKGNIADATFTLPAGVTATSVLDANSDPLDSTKFAISENKVTVRKEAIADKAGVCEFIAIAGKDLYPLYVYVGEFADGAYKTGAGTVTKGNGAIVVDGDVSYMPMQAFNFAEGFQAKVDFKSVPGYFNGGRNFNKTGYVRFSFYDPYSGNTLVFTLYTNYEKDEVTTTDTALYRAYSMTDREGKTVISESLSMVNISQSTNPDPLGAHIVKFAASAGAIEITVDSARAITVSGIGTFNLSASVLTVTTPASAEDAASKVGILFADKDATLDYAAITTEETPIAPAKPAKKRGCGSETGASAMLAGLLLLGAASVVLFVRRREKSAR